MRQTLLGLVTRLATVSESVNREEDEIRSLYDMDCVYVLGTAAEAFLNEPHPSARALEAFLAALPRAALYSVLALMYSGRDGEDALEVADDWCAAPRPDAAVVRTIFEKRSRMEYIAKGISSLGVESLPDLLDHVARQLGQS